MRLLDRVVREARALTSNAKAMLSDLLKASQFDTLITCCKMLGGCQMQATDEGRKQFLRPSTSVKCGYMLKKAAEVLRGQALRNKDIHTKDDLDMFLELY